MRMSRNLNDHSLPMDLRAPFDLQFHQTLCSSLRNTLNLHSPCPNLTLVRLQGSSLRFDFESSRFVFNFKVRLQPSISSNTCSSLRNTLNLQGSCHSLTLVHLQGSSLCPNLRFNSTSATAPPCATSSLVLSGRLIKRKIGCIDVATQMVSSGFALFMRIQNRFIWVCPVHVRLNNPKMKRETQIWVFSV
ncbi:hypothetical protein L1987_01241 [Smallanthus sonchifolius]|uniref:Uncharacterized protein n=1 Tax=Smallanthus sonchifolius TaxID=185202 RepID=A0ACB9K4M9_9ASTR|nr:hypothetical protein L1987_01241 [Smallanthus sonchifolius]